MTTVGEILDEFFSPFSSERLWIMPSSDNYTRIVREWRPVIDAMSRIKAKLPKSCAVWEASYKTKAAWAPTMSDAPKQGAYREFVASPPGTDYVTCREAFVVYWLSRSAKLVVSPVFPVIQTQNLYTCSIGSFNIYTTVDAIDCAAKTATMNYWMYNSMSKRSFGRFADHPVFSMSGMATQYMWWNWAEYVEWSSGLVRTKLSPMDKNGWK
ncbi:MAG: hypothetical protein IPK80_07670 [Nannocystis sp.]|nr:hypothetical protein [Nannocystis sp.]